MRIALVTVLVLVMALGGAFALLRTPDLDPAALTAKYASEASRFADNGAGLRVHYRDEGDPEGPPVILVHGSGGSLHNWERLKGHLDADYRLISYTQPGHGLTGPHARDDYSFAGLAEALDLVIEETGVERFVLAGHSMGGWVAWRYALARPDRVSALILVDASGAPDARRNGAGAEEDAPPPLAYRLATGPFGRFFIQHVTPRFLIEKTAYAFVADPAVMDESSVDRYWELLRYPGNRRAAALRMSVEREPAYADRLPEITAPTLLVWGAADKQTPVGIAQTFAARLPDARLAIYEGVGHMPMEETPRRTAEDIDAFLREVLSEPQAGR